MGTALDLSCYYSFVQESGDSPPPHLLPKALHLTKPSPAGPNPLPGVVTMSHFWRISANTSQLSVVVYLRQSKREWTATLRHLIGLALTPHSQTWPCPGSRPKRRGRPRRHRPGVSIREGMMMSRDSEVSCHLSALPPVPPLLSTPITLKPMSLKALSRMLAFSL